MEELKFERDEGTWAAAPGLELRIRARPPVVRRRTTEGVCLFEDDAEPSWRRLARALQSFETSPGRMGCDGSRGPARTPPSC